MECAYYFALSNFIAVKPGFHSDAITKYEEFTASFANNGGDDFVLLNVKDLGVVLF